MAFVLSAESQSQTASDLAASAENSRTGVRVAGVVASFQGLVAGVLSVSCPGLTARGLSSYPGLVANGLSKIPAGCSGGVHSLDRLCAHTIRPSHHGSQRAKTAATQST